jgi:murein DD-endopeptidase MepM/ murein hydrolase activator NlpD
MATTRLSLRPLVFVAAACYGGAEPLGESVGEATTFTSNVTATPDESTSAGGPSTGEEPAPTTGDIEETGGSSSSTSGDVTSVGETTSSTGSGTTGVDDPLADCPRLRVMVPPGEVLNVRPTPATTMAPVAELGNGALVDTVAVVDGETIDGNSKWYEIASPSGFVFSGFVACTFDEPPPPPEGFFLPLQCGVQTKVTQGNDGDVSHQGKDFYAFDLGVGLGTPLVPMADGVVQHIFDQTKPGDPCYDGGGPECGPYGNLVVVLHGDNTSTYYKHLSEVHVTVGEAVDRAHVIGLSGTTGYSTGPHAHVMRQENCGVAKCQSIPLSFIEAGVPVTGQFVTSQNCP